ncbi:acyltransferase domain-containing protein [Kutzneria chonburiensis]|uniref:Acyltransferase domain-containing protein n=1 Tax=Kutzneria chonburiensis TaxID=1483604 RepID=A0ABV6MK94_9PSEU|nr:acyltransferase domain-containing protein [Kutzneria chonburiensis]
MTEARSACPRLVLLLPGQGSQYPRMAAGLYASEPVFAAALDEVFDAMGAEGVRIRADWLSDRPVVSTDHVTRAQPLLFAVDYAVGRLVWSWAGQPGALLGHSAGEVVAATLAGVFSLADATRLMLDRVERLAGAPPGGMLAVAASPDELAPFLDDEVAIAAINAPRNTILSGFDRPLARVVTALRAQGYWCQPVPAQTAFHSPLLGEFSLGAADFVNSVPVEAPTMPICSGYTADFLDMGELRDGKFWAEQPARPVLFWAALNRLLAQGEYVLVEAGPGRLLSGIARRHPAVRAGRHATHAVLPDRPGHPDADRAAAVQARNWLAAQLSGD